MVACDFFVVITATFRTLSVFVVMEIGSRQILHQNVTAHPTPEWTLQQLREALPGDHPYRFVIHDRDRIFSADVDKSLTNLGVRVLRLPFWNLPKRRRLSVFFSEAKNDVFAAIGEISKMATETALIVRPAGDLTFIG